MKEEEFVDHVKTLHEQNLNGREDFLQAFEKGIRAAYEELQQVKSVDLADVVGSLATVVNSALEEQKTSRKILKVSCDDFQKRDEGGIVAWYFVPENTALMVAEDSLRVMSGRSKIPDVQFYVEGKELVVSAKPFPKLDTERIHSDITRTLDKTGIDYSFCA